MITITQNCGFSLSTELTNSDDTPKDLSQVKVKLVIKKDITMSDDSGLSSTIEKPDTNILLFQFPKTKTSKLSPGKYILGVKILKENGMDEEVLREEVEVVRGVVNE